MLTENMWILYVIPLCSLEWLTVSAAVTTGPTIETEQPIIEGKTISLSCKATCTNGSCQYTWTGYGLGSSVTTNPLPLGNVTRSHHNTEYICTVKDIDNVPKTAKTTLNVYYGPEKVTVKSGSPVKTVEGTSSDNLDIICETSSCNPPCSTFEWTLSGKAVSNVPKLFPTNKVLSRNDAGVYTCKVTNGETQAKNATVDLNILYPPQVDMKWDSVTNVLTCKATGNPNTYTFDPIRQYVESTLVQTYKPNVTGDTASVSLDTKDYQDTGRYECNVNNTIKAKRNETAIKVKDLPVLASTTTSYNMSKGANFPVMISLYSYPAVSEVSISDHNITLGCSSTDDKITLTCESQTMPIPFHGKNVTVTGHKLTLTFHEILEEDFRTHTFIMSNEVGSLITNITFYPEGPPDTPTSFEKTDSSHESITFTLVTGFYNGGGQTIVVEYKLTGNQPSWNNGTRKYAGEDKNKVKVVVEGLSAETLYEFRAFAYNKYNRSMYTNILQAETNKAPVSLGVIVGSVVGGVVVLCIIVVVVVILVIKYRRKEKEPDAAGTYKSPNKDLTLEMPTTPGIQSGRMNNVYVEEPLTPESPSQTILYENNMVNAGENTFQDRTNQTGNYDVPPSRAPYVNSFNQGFGNTVAPYDVPRLQTPKPVGHYDSPRSLGVVGSYSKDGSEADGTMPPYLELNNPEFVEEAYLDVSKSKMLVDGSRAKPKLTKQGTETEEEYLDMNALTGSAVKEDKHSKSKESPYNNMSGSKPYENTEFSSKKKGKTEKEEEDYQNVAMYQKIKVAFGGKHGKKKNGKKDVEKKDYQNVAKYKKKPKPQPSEDSQSDYMSMEVDSNRKSAVSIPDYNAPPPPPDADLEVDYVNMRLAYSKR